MRILVAEDDSRLLTQLDAFLQQNGYSVDLADNGEHALFLIREYSYDLAIVDIGMPKLDGFEVIRKARQADMMPEPMTTSPNPFITKSYLLEQKH